MIDFMRFQILCSKSWERTESLLYLLHYTKTWGQIPSNNVQVRHRYSYSTSVTKVQGVIMSGRPLSTYRQAILVNRRGLILVREFCLKTDDEVEIYRKKMSMCSLHIHVHTQICAPICKQHTHILLFHTSNLIKPKVNLSLSIRSMCFWCVMVWGFLVIGKKCIYDATFSTKYSLLGIKKT